MESASWDRTLARLDHLAGLRLSEKVMPLLLDQPDPPAAAARFEAWISALASPGSIAHHLAADPESSRLLIRCLGHSSHIARILVQNSEYGLLLLDPGEVCAPLTRKRLEDSGRRQLKQAVSYTHQLDRIRCLKQEALVRTAAQEYSGLSDPEGVWTQLSLTADACLTLAHEASWNDYCTSRGISQPPRLAVIGMGKLGGSELNTSSDVDLVFVVPDESTDDELTHASRFASKFIRALSDSMGRGSLYRVDMRLRPFGRSGDLVARFRTIANYLENYAEAWEHLALIRSRLIVGPQELADDWDALRKRICFRKGRADWQVQEIRQMRKRIEGISSPLDIKRGEGGIRDVEFTAQLLQLVFGHLSTDLQQKETLPTLGALCRHGLIPCEAEKEMKEGLLLLRLVEHHLQMEGDQQTHLLPEAGAKQSLLAAACGDEDWESLSARITHARLRLRHWQEALLGPGMAESPAGDERVRLSESSPEAVKWLDSLPDSKLLWSSLAENLSSWERVTAIAVEAPALLDDLKLEPGISEQLLSGEIIEAPTPLAAPSGQRLRAARLRAACREALTGEQTFSLDWSSAVEEALVHLMKECAPSLTLIALGSLAERSLGYSSDADLLLASESPSARAEMEGRTFMKRLADLRQAGSPLEADFRLRPEGRQGPIFVHPESLKRYVQTRMEPWERIALSRRRLIFGSGEPVQLLDELVLHGSLTAIEAAQLHHIKERVESERAIRKSGFLDVKLGPGGMDDIVWIHHLCALKKGWRVQDRSLTSIRLRMTLEGEITEEEAELLGSAWQRWNRERLRMSFSGNDSPLIALSGDTLQRSEAGLDVNGLAASVRLLLEHRWTLLLDS